MKKKSKIKKTIGEVDVGKEVAERVGQATANYYDRMVLDSLSLSNLFYSGKYRNKKVPRYLWLTIPAKKKTRAVKRLYDLLFKM